MQYLRITVLILSGLVVFWSLHGLVNAANVSTYDDGIRYTRMSSVSGDVFIQSSFEMEEQPARMNHPFLPGDRLITGSDGAVEIQIDDGSIAWVYHDSKMDLDTLAFGEAGTTQVTGFKLWVGEAYFRFRTPANLESVRFVGFGHGRVYVDKQSLFRIHTEPDGRVECYVKGGEIRISEQGNDQVIRAGHAMSFDPGDDMWKTIDVPVDDVFDEWVIERDKYLGGAYMNKDYIPPHMKDRAVDLEENGRWVYNVYLGSYCWSPFVSIGWVPYHYGYWDWIPGWGWTWIPDEPWGWVPYHYGYWAFYYEFGWMWVPHWRWGPHWASWRCHGHSVHWVPIHPEDRLDNRGRLIEGAVPRNSRIELGVPVEASQDINELLAHSVVQSNKGVAVIPKSVQWRNDPPESITEQAKKFNTNSTGSHGPDSRIYKQYYRPEYKGNKRPTLSPSHHDKGINDLKTRPEKPAAQDAKKNRVIKKVPQKSQSSTVKKGIDINSNSRNKPDLRDN